MVQSCSLNSAFHGFRIIFLRCESAIGLDEKITRLSVFFLFQTTLRLFHQFICSVLCALCIDDCAKTNEDGQD